MNGVNTLTTTMFSLIVSLFHTSKASQRIAVICCCCCFCVISFHWCFFLFYFHFSIYAVCVKYFIPLSVAFYRCDACQTFGCMIRTAVGVWSKFTFFVEYVLLTHQTHFSCSLVHHIYFHIVRHHFAFLNHFSVMLSLCASFYVSIRLPPVTLIINTAVNL